jgi:hypothetical protein
MIYPLKAFSKNILNDAEKFLSSCKQVDYQRVLEHDVKAVDDLYAVLRELQLRPLSPGWAVHAVKDSRSAGAGLDVVPTMKDEVAVHSEVTRREEIFDEISEQGFGERLDKVYDSFADGRIRPIRKVPHRNGLPFFNAVVAADFSPISGLHGVFISNSEVVSAVLPFPCEAHEWQLQARKTYSTLAEMTEYVTLLAAGFELP